MRALPVLLVLLASPLVAAQAHEHGAGGKAMAAVLHDGPPGGRAVAGGPTHFGFALLDPDGKPVSHRDANFTVEQDGRVVFATEDAHEYDGLFGFDVTFTRPGPYRVVAQSAEMETGVFEGVVVPPADATEATIDFQQKSAGSGSHAVEGVVSILGPDGKILPHTDAVLEFREKGSERLAARVHAHVHEAPIAFTQGLDLPGEYVLRVVAYNAFPTGRGPDVKAVVADFPVSVGPFALPALPRPPAAPPEAMEPIGARAETDGLALHATYDPQNQVVAGQVARLAALVTDASRMPLAHVDFSFTLQGPRGLVFASESLHEYDGVFEYVFTPDAPGAYDGVLTATDGDRTVSVPYHLQVLPPAAPVMGAGVATVTVEGLEGAVAGQPVDLTFSIASTGGPVQHSEVDVTVFHEGEAPVYQFKLHTHGSGSMAATLVFPHPGDWKVRVDPLPTLPQPLLFRGPGGPDAPIVFQASVQPGAGAEGDAAAAAKVQGQNRVPAWGLAGLVGVGLAAALLRRRA